VNVLQQALNQQTGAGLKTDGKFGPKTEAAVRAFQEKNGIEPSGVICNQTLAKIQGKEVAATETAPAEETPAAEQPAEQGATQAGELGSLGVARRFVGALGPLLGGVDRGAQAVNPGGQPRADLLCFGIRRHLGRGVAPLGDRFLKVVALAQAKTEAPEMNLGSASDQPASGKIATKVFQLDFLRVNEFMPQLQSIANILNLLRQVLVSSKATKKKKLFLLPLASGARQKVHVSIGQNHHFLCKILLI
jgi:hypothetical protein